MVYFWMVPSKGIVCLVAEIGKQVLVGPGAMWEAETWSRCIFACVKTAVVYFWIREPCRRLILGPGPLEPSQGYHGISERPPSWDFYMTALRFL